MCGSVSPMSVMGVILSPLHVGRAPHSGHKEPKGNTGEDSLPECVVSLVPHLLVEVVDLLESLHIVLFHGCVGNSPKSQVMHVGQLSPGVLEFNTLVLQEFVLESGLSQILSGSAHLLEILER